MAPPKLTQVAPLSNPQPQVKNCDMVLELETEARDLIVMALDKFIATGDYEAAASLIKTNMDKKWGLGWHCFIVRVRLANPRSLCSRRVANRRSLYFFFPVLAVAGRGLRLRCRAPGPAANPCPLPARLVPVLQMLNC